MADYRYFQRGIKDLVTGAQDNLDPMDFHDLMVEMASMMRTAEISSRPRTGK